MVVQPHILLVGSDQYLTALADTLLKDGSKAVHCEIDLVSQKSEDPVFPGLTNVIDEAIKSMGHIDSLIFCDKIRAIENHRPQAQTLTQQTLDATKGLLISARCAALKMIETGSPGQIIIICDTSSIAGRRNCMVSSTVGGALVGMGKSLAKELGRYQISVNIICIGAMEGIGSQSLFTDAEAIMLKATGMGKKGNLSHLAKNILHLARGEHWLNGQVLHINDGLVM